MKERKNFVYEVRVLLVATIIILLTVAVTANTNIPEDPTPRDMCSQLTKKQDCDPGVETEYYVKDHKGEWRNADTKLDAVKVKYDTETELKIEITNTGECSQGYVNVTTELDHPFEYIEANPPPDNVVQKPNITTVLEWEFEGIIIDNYKTETIIIEVEDPGPPCTYQHIIVVTITYCACGDPYCSCAIWTDEDHVWVHSVEEISRPIINFLEKYPNLFPLLHRLLDRLGLQ